MTQTLKVKNLLKQQYGFNAIVDGADTTVFLAPDEEWEGEFNDDEANALKARSEGKNPSVAVDGFASTAKSSGTDLAAAVALLEDGNPEHWTQAGNPRLSALKELSGGDVTAEDYEALPDDKKRTRKTA